MNGARVIRQLPLLAAIGALVFAFLPVSPVRAADIIWDTPTIISGDTDVSTTGTLVHPYAFGNLLVPGATVNGVTFARFAVPNLSSASVTVDSVTLAVSPEFYSDNSSPGSGLPPFSEPLGRLQSAAGERGLRLCQL